MPKDLKLHQAEHHITALFNELCGRGQIIKVKVIPDFIAINTLMEIKEEIKNELTEFIVYNK